MARQVKLRFFATGVYTRIRSHEAQCFEESFWGFDLSSEHRFQSGHFWPQKYLLSAAKSRVYIYYFAVPLHLGERLGGEAELKMADVFRAHPYWRGKVISSRGSEAQARRASSLGTRSGLVRTGAARRVR